MRKMREARTALLTALFLITTGFAVAACARTEMTSYVDPSYRSGTKFSSVIVVGVNMSLEEKQVAENAAAGAFRQHGAMALRGVDVIPPTRNYTDEQISQLLIETGAESILILGAGARDIAQSYVPPTYVPGSTYGTATTTGNYYGNTYSGRTTFNVYQTPGYTVGGYTVSKPVATYSAALLDMRNGSVVWQADASSKGNAFADYGDLATSMAQEAVKQLAAEGLF